MPKKTISTAIFLSIITPGISYFITVDAHAEECFFDKVAAGTKMSLTFEIAEGGFLDIDYRIVGPGNRLIMLAEREYSAKYTFYAYKPGIYTYCFSNKRSTKTPKVVMFHMLVEETPSREEKSSETGGESITKLEDMIRELSGSLARVKREQEYTRIRDRIHWAINEGTNSRVVLWWFFEALIIAGMTVGQIYYMRRIYEVRRVV